MKLALEYHVILSRKYPMATEFTFQELSCISALGNKTYSVVY